MTSSESLNLSLEFGSWISGNLALSLVAGRGGDGELHSTKL
jgi:hypothetical protein